MADLLSLKAEIESIITGMAGVTYYRGNHAEVNKILQKEKIVDCFAFHIDQTTITGEVSGNYVYKVVPTEILFIYKNAKLDDKLTDIDTLVNQAEIKADEFHDLLIQSPVIDNSPEWENYELNRLEAFKKYDTIVSGVLFTWNAPIPRSKFYCS
jgi:hypothetical protein